MAANIVAEVDQLIRNFSMSGSDEQRKHFENLLTEWKSSPGAFDCCLEIVGTQGLQVSTYLFALMALAEAVQRNWKDNASVAERAFACCLRNIGSAKAAGQNIYLHLMNVLGVSVFYNAALYEHFAEIPAPDQVVFFEMFLQEAERDVTRQAREEMGRGCTGLESRWKGVPLAEHIMVLLQNSELSASWFAVHKDAMRLFPSPVLHVWAPLVPKLGTLVERFDPSFRGAVMSFYEEVLSVEPVWIAEDEGERKYILSVIGIMIFLAHRLTQMMKDDEDIVHYLSVILTTTIDYGMEFFGNEAVVEFSEKLFEEVTKQLQEIVKVDRDEFFTVFHQIAETLSAGDAGSFNSGKWIAMYLGMIINNINGGDLEMCCPDLARIVSLFTKEKNRTVSEFLATNVSHPSPGIYYVIAFSHKYIRKMLTTQLAHSLQRLGDPSQTPVTCLPFIARCAPYAPDFVTNGCFLNIVFYWMGKAPPLEVATALRGLAFLAPGVFVTEDSRYWNPLWDFLPNAEPEVASILFATMFAILKSVPIPEDDLQKKLEQMGAVLFQKVPTSFSTPYELECFFSFLLPIIEGDGHSYTYPPVMGQFFFAIFEKLRQLLASLWGLEDELVQRSLCEFIGIAIRANWLQDHSFAIEWISQMIQRAPIREHFSVVMRELIPDMPIAQFTPIFRSAVEINIDMHWVFDLIQETVDARPEIVKDVFGLELILYPLTGLKVAWVERSCDVLTDMSKRALLSPQELKIVLQSLVRATLQLAPIQWKGLDTIHYICMTCGRLTSIEDVRSELRAVFVATIGAESPLIDGLLVLLTHPEGWTGEQGNQALEAIKALSVSKNPQ